MISALFFVLAGAWQPAETEVTFKGAGGLELRGTLSVPEGVSGQVPGVLLLPGSGPTDRDGNQPPVLITDLLKQTASRLTKEGYVCFRFDKRATPGYSSSWPKEVEAQNDFFSWDSFVGDAKAALAFLRSQKQVDPSRTVIFGHSEGGMIAVQIGKDLAGTSEAPAGLILASTAGRTSGHVIREQVASNLRRSGMAEPVAKTYNDYVDTAIKQLIKDGTVPPDPPPGLAGLFPPSAAKLLRSYFTTDPAKLAAAYDGPVLIVQGEKDIQVSPDRDTPLMTASLKARPKGTVETFIVPSASHNLKHVDDKETEAGLVGDVVPAALDKIAEWMKATFPKKTG